MRMRFRSLFFSMAVLVFAASAFAQEFRATLTGRIVDPDGLGMPGVTVSATNMGTNEVASAVTNSEGVYSLPFLRPGNYTVSAELEGFRKCRHAVTTGKAPERPMAAGRKGSSRRHAV